MRLIAKRGLFEGPDREKENTPKQIELALSKGYWVEIDIWASNLGELWIGHDYPQYMTSLRFLENRKFYCHAKNLKAYDILSESLARVFLQDEESVSLVSDGTYWINENYRFPYLYDLSKCLISVKNIDFIDTGKILGIYGDNFNVFC